jgi:prepilin-type processing-associated H-X9-DG protein
MLYWDGGIRFDGSDAGAPATNAYQMGGVYGPENPGDTYGLWCDPQDAFTATQFPLDQVVHLGACNGNKNTAPVTAKTYIDPSPSSVNWIGKRNLDMAAGGAEGSDDNLAYQRYRHLGNTSCNFLFYDGHVEPRKLGEVKIRDLSVAVQ